jgi:hypothetical protein
VRIRAASAGFASLRDNRGESDDCSHERVAGWIERHDKACDAGV